MLDVPGPLRARGRQCADGPSDQRLVDVAHGRARCRLPRQELPRGAAQARLRGHGRQRAAERAALHGEARGLLQRLAEGCADERVAGRRPLVRAEHPGGSGLPRRAPEPGTGRDRPVAPAGAAVGVRVHGAGCQQLRHQGQPQGPAARGRLAAREALRAALRVGGDGRQRHLRRGADVLQGRADGEVAGASRPGLVRRDKQCAPLDLQDPATGEAAPRYRAGGWHVLHRGRSHENAGHAPLQVARRVAGHAAAVEGVRRLALGVPAARGAADRRWALPQRIATGRRLHRARVRSGRGGARFGRREQAILCQPLCRANHRGGSREHDGEGARLLPGRQPDLHRPPADQHASLHAAVRLSLRILPCGALARLYARRRRLPRPGRGVGCPGPLGHRPPGADGVRHRPQGPGQRRRQVADNILPRRCRLHGLEPRRELDG
mmetsp:Transcript_35264/g.95606  ORF Transcript_35264/g.95606 Transcript_35264/m.95606 type:complete len:436 (-) Transcript_35264:389-1696(-)